MGFSLRLIALIGSFFKEKFNVKVNVNVVLVIVYIWLAIYKFP